MQSWLSLLDMGLTATLSREVAYYHNQEGGVFKIKQLLRSLEIIFLVINLIIIFGITLSSHWIALRWLKVENLSYSEVTYCIVLIGIIISFRFFADLYRAGILGIEQQIWLNGVSIFLTTIQYGGAYLLLRFVTRIPHHFFEYQLLIAAIEPIFLGIKFYRIFPMHANRVLGFKISWDMMRKIFPFASSFFYVGIIWVLLTQSDKLILSHLLPLTTYGYFALVTVISGGILQFAAPISLALLPRMTHLLSQGKNQEMLRLYKSATQTVAVVMFPLTGILAIFGNEIVYIWTGNQTAANWAGPILFWYALGNGITSISAFQYYLQFAHGILKLHVIFNTVFALIAFPLILFSAYHYGALGTAITWFLMQSIAFIIWPPIVHHKYAPGIHLQWLSKDIFPIFSVVLIALFFIKKIPIHFELLNRPEGFTILGVITIFVLIASTLASSAWRSYITKFIQERRGIRI
ncbi:MAG: hypothetical protein ACD_46C00058G0002 [uncultured bacterium]|nr:MAG: hypothetical protein ACD_46C00058G0002 [uncultured bacterium]